MESSQRGQVAGEPAGLGELLDQHAELRDLVAAVRESADPRMIGGLLRRLTVLLEAHFASEEHSWTQGNGARSEDTEALAREHAELLERLRVLTGAADSEAQELVERSPRTEIDDLLGRLERHDARETELFGSGIGLERADSSAPALSSRALEVNLRRTAVDVVIPSEQRVLLEVTSGRYGIHEGTRKLLREINHPYIGWSQTLEDLHRRAMNDLPHYLASERAAQAVEVFCALYARASEETKGELQETAIRYQTLYWEKAARQAGDQLGALLPLLNRSMGRLEALLRRAPRLGAVSSARLAHVVRALLEGRAASGSPALESGSSLLALSLEQGYEGWLALDDAAAWWHVTTGGAAPAPPPLAALSHEQLREYRRSCERLSRSGAPPQDRARALLELPDHARIARIFLEAADAIASAASPSSKLVQVRWLVRMLSFEVLGGVHEQVLAELGRLHADVVAASNPAEFEEFVREIFGTLRRLGFMTSPTAFRLVARMGAATLSSGDPERVRCLTEEMLRCAFPRPRFVGFGEQWQVRSDPAHLAAIRAFLEVIEANPSLAQPLVAALVVQLSTGGVIVTDTDLFQKDVSQLLNSGVAPLYHTLLHLLRLLPVYYAEIGAEGELRDVSSRIDEIDARRDPVCHFLRKQCHVESSPLLLGFVEAIAAFWESGDPEGLRGYLPSPLYERLPAEPPDRASLGAIVREVLRGEAVDSLFALELAELRRRLAGCDSGLPLQREKVELLAILRRLLGRKYELSHADLVERLGAWRGADAKRLNGLHHALDHGDDEKALDALLALLEELQQIILAEKQTRGLEDIYRKRHIAVGIPSVYGRYREEKLEAVGLSFRIGSLVNVLFERLVSRSELSCPTRSSLRRVARWLHLFLRATQVEGCRSRGLATGIETLERALADADTSLDQYLNVFQLLSRGVEQLIRLRFRDVYEDVLELLLGLMIERGEIVVQPGANREEVILEISERFLRDRIGESLGLQQLDRLLGRVLGTLVEVRGRLDRNTADQLVSLDLDRASLSFDRRRPSPLDGPVHLGNKGYLIRRLAQEGLPVPAGFVLTKEVFRGRAALETWPALRRELAELVRRRLDGLERRTHSRFGDPQRPLLLSVRSSSTLSMPGMLDTYLNVGMNPELAESLGARSGSPWGAWDGYRRFVQSWGMARGLEREAFDALMRDAKLREGVRKKAELSPADMRSLALRYRTFVQGRGVEIVDDPFAQLLACVDLVLRSWDSERARVYRNELGIAEEWGTAVIVQSMVYGNLHQRSGTGVVLTCNPQQGTQEVDLHGDFVVQAQGDDIVGGLVETLPIRRGERGPGERSLEDEFPRIYRALRDHARHLVRDLGMFHQEIEFTFESEDPKDLYILQTRDTVMSQVAEVTAFLPGLELEAAKLATGIGAGGGALSGRVAHSREELAGLRRRFPRDPIVLLRPDTVPEDIPLIVQVDGLVTALGGATSHAALVAQRLGRTCVVGCPGLEVYERAGRSKLGGRELATGDPISISGLDGSVYGGSHPVTTIRRQRLS